MAVIVRAGGIGLKGLIPGSPMLPDPTKGFTEHIQDTLVFHCKAAKDKGETPSFEASPGNL